MNAIDRVNAGIKAKGWDFQISEADIGREFIRDRLPDRTRFWRNVKLLGPDKILCNFQVYNQSGCVTVFSESRLSPNDKRAIRKTQKAAKDVLAQSQENLAQKIPDILKRIKRSSGFQTSPYALIKKIDALKLEELGVCLVSRDQSLVIPMLDEFGKAWSLQTIYLKNGAFEKRFLRGGRTKALMAILPGSSDLVYIAEGFATASAVWEALERKNKVICAFNKNNLESTLKLFPKATLVCDWDGETFNRQGINPGLKECIRLSRKYGNPVAVGFGGSRNLDFSDYWLEDPDLAKQLLSTPVVGEGLYVMEEYAEKKHDLEKLAPTFEIAQEFRRIDFSHIIEPPKNEPADLTKIKPSILPDRRGEEGEGKPIATLNNYKALMKAMGATLRYNVISKREEWFLSGVHPSQDNFERVIYAHLEDACARVGLPDGKLPSYLTQLCDENQFNPVKSWIESNVWDGRSRLLELFDTVECDPEEEELKKTFIRKWLILAVAAAYEPNGVAAPGMLVFQGPQFIGKTRWLLSLVPPELKLAKDGVIIEVKNVDTVREAIMFWLVELGELDGTFRRSEQSSLKAWLTKQYDIVRSPYAKVSNRYPRRTVFFGSVNEAEFLTDKTGNRRYWVIETKKLNADHNIDMQQLWAEVLTLYKSGEQWWPDSAQMAAMNESNEKYLESDPIEEKLRRMFDWSVHGEDLTASQICERLGLDRITRRETVDVARCVRKLNRGLKPEDLSHKNGKKLWVGRDISRLSGLKVPEIGPKTPWSSTRS